MSEYNELLTAMWNTKTGSAASMDLDEYSVNKIKQVMANLKPGGKLLLKKLSDESRAKIQEKMKARGSRGDANHFFLEYISPEKNQAFKDKRTAPSGDGL